MTHASPEKIISLLDLTSLNDTDDASTIDTLCKKAITTHGHVAAVCVYPQFVKQVVMYFVGKPIRIATVANFPQGNEALEMVLSSIQESIQTGAQEIDVVFPYQQYLAGDIQSVSDFIHACKAVCGDNILLKVILETGALKDLSIIQAASRCALLAGADFLKTSTGKIAIGATPEAAEVMLRVIKELSIKLQRSIGFKASGGVRTIEQAQQYIDLASSIMGAEWVTAAHFRIGTSQVIVS